MIKLHCYRLAHQGLYARLPYQYFHIALSIHGLMYWVDAKTYGNWDIQQRYPVAQLVMSSSLRFPVALGAIKAYQGLTSQPMSNLRYYRDILKGKQQASRKWMPDNCLRHVCNILGDLGFVIPDCIITTDQLVKHLWLMKQFQVSPQSTDPLPKVQEFLNS